MVPVDPGFNIARFSRYVTDAIGNGNDRRPEFVFDPNSNMLASVWFEDDELLELLDAYDPDGLYMQPDWKSEMWSLLDKMEEGATLTAKERKALDQHQARLLKRQLQGK